MKSQITVAKKFSAACAALVLFTVLLGSVTISSIGGIQSRLQAIVVDSLPGVYQVSMLDSHVYELRGNFWKHIANSDKAAKAKIEGQNEELERRIQEVLGSYEKTITQAEDRQLFGNIQAPYERYVAAWKDVELLSREGKSEEAIAR